MDTQFYNIRQIAAIEKADSHFYESAF